MDSVLSHYQKTVFEKTPLPLDDLRGPSVLLILLISDLIKLHGSLTLITTLRTAVIQRVMNHAHFADPT